MSSDPLEAVCEAERIVWAAGWRFQEQEVLGRLAGTKGLARARLDARSEVIQLVAYDGEHLGHVRRESGPGQAKQWVAVIKDRGRRIGVYPTADAAAEALARARGEITRRAVG